MLDKFKDAFREEASELLIQLEETLLELESSPEDRELVNSAFRAIHTIKGSSGMFGFEAIAGFAHVFENLLDKCRSGKRVVDKHVIDSCLSAKDHLRALLDLDGTSDPEVEREGATILSRLEEEPSGGENRPITFPGSLDGSKSTAPEGLPSETVADAGAGKGPEEGGLLRGETGVAAAGADDADILATWRIRFVPGKDIFLNGTNILALLRELSSLGETTVFPCLDGIPPLDGLDPERCYTAWEVFLTSDRGYNAVKDVFIFVESVSELSIERLADAELSGFKARKLGQILVDRGLVTNDAIEDALKSQRKLGEVLLERRAVTPGQIASALTEQEHLKKVQDRHSETAASIRVPSAKLDALVDLVGELVTLQARLGQVTLGLEDALLGAITESFDRLISQLRDNTMSIRMMPIGSSFNRFRRVVRDLSSELGKEVDFVTSGEDTELDKTVIEKLADPLVHLIRNCLDHGLERPEDREAAGKRRTGTITLSARHSGAYVLIQVSDDGRGMDRDAIRKKAVEKGLISPGIDLDDRSVLSLVMLPGFSTAEKITTVSGRGVGMDVVKREIESLGGSVEIRSEPGTGTSISLKIPLTLAIIEGLLTRVDDAFFVIPLAAVDGCVEALRGDDASEIIRYREEFVPVLDLRKFFAIEGERPAIEQIVIATTQDSRTGILVDSVIGNNQTVIKPLGKVYRNVEGLGGATILGDGTVALILDVNRLSLKAATERKR